MTSYDNWKLLFLHEAKSCDVYKDTVRIHEANRDGIKAGRICRIWIKGSGDTLVAVRGLPDVEQLDVRIDEVTRERLGITQVQIGKPIDVRIEEANWGERIRWVLDASDPAARVSMGVAVWSLILGIGGLLLGFLSLFHS